MTFLGFCLAAYVAVTRMQRVVGMLWRIALALIIAIIARRFAV